MMCALGSERVAANAVSTAMLRSIPITSRAPQRAASCVWRPLPQPPSSTTLSRKNSGVTGAIQPRSCAAYFSSSCVKCCHCQPNPAAVARLSLSTCSRSAKRGMPEVIGNEELHDVQRNSPSIISPSSDLVTERLKDPSQEGHTRKVSSFSFKPLNYNIPSSHKKAPAAQTNLLSLPDYLCFCAFAVYQSAAMEASNKATGSIVIAPGTYAVSPELD